VIVQGRVVAIVLVIVVAAVGAQAVLSSNTTPIERQTLAPGVAAAPGDEKAEAVDPLAWRASRAEEFAETAARGFAHPLYTRVPGGARATAERVARWREQIEEVAPRAGVDADTLEGLVYLESAGNPEAAADPRFVGAVGLTQILAETANSLLDMKADPAEARKITRSIARVERRGRSATAERLRARRRAVDERFDPQKALEGMARYMVFARGQLDDRADLAVASYHMGVGNLQNVLKAYGEDDVSYTQLYFDATPEKHPEAARMLADFGDESATYLWRVRAAREIMRLYREDAEELDRRAALMSRKASAEELLHPQGETEAFTGPESLRRAYEEGVLRELPADLLTGHGIRVAKGMGELAPKLKESRRLYRGLRPEALATLVYVGAATEGPITVTSTVRDGPYQRLLTRVNIQATREFSLHTTGFAFDLLKRFRSQADERAVRTALRRLQSHDLITWVEEPAAFHVVAADSAKALLPVLEQPVEPPDED
jgi:hypothetical protein